MDENDAFIESEYLEEVTVDDNPGSSLHLQEVVVGQHGDGDARPKNDTDGVNEDLFEEEEISGQVIEGEDGQLYVLLEDDGTEDVELDEDPANVEVQETTDGDQVIVFQSNPIHPDAAGMKRCRPGRAIPIENENGQLEEVIQFADVDNEDGVLDHHGDDMIVGAAVIAEANDEHIMHHGMVMEPIPAGMKLRRTRVYGTCRCTECGQSFVNTARLERHLAVHQVFGSFLCPLCGKTYKYEYNLFYHWRRTCRDLNDLMSLDDRKTMDVNALRSLVDEVAQKKAEYGPIEIGISRSVLFQSGPLARLEMPANPLGRRGTTCRACGVIVHLTHLAHHLNLHKGMESATPDARSATGGFFCDLCGLNFRQHFNLIKHWRTGCAEIQANLPDEVELTLDDAQLKTMVCDLLKRASTNDAILEGETSRLKMERGGGGEGGGVGGGRRMGGNEHIDVVGYDVGDDDHLMGGGGGRRVDHHHGGLELSSEAAREREEDRRAYEEAGGGGEGGELGGIEKADGVVYADDFENEEVLMMEEVAAAGGAIVNRQKWNLQGAPIQCTECYRSFANTGRLERHMAGFHASHGSHHCALCGNRFKYDYNLLYHYRKSCPYTKAFIDRDVRDQMDASNLRKLVRSLAQKDLRLTPQTRPMMRLPKQNTQQSNDAIVRREMLRPVLSNAAPQILTMPRRGMSGKSCPICGVMFYTPSAIERHMNMRHGMDYNLYEDEEREDELQQFEEEAAAGAAASGSGMQRVIVGSKQQENAKKAAASAAAAAHVAGDEEDDEPPPMLEAQEPGESALMKSPGRHLEHQEQHLQQQLQYEDNYDEAEVNQMIARGDLNEGDLIVFEETGRNLQYTVKNGAIVRVIPEVGGGEEIDDVAAEYDVITERRRPTMQEQPQQHQQPSHSKAPMQQQQRSRYAAGGSSQQQQSYAAARLQQQQMQTAAVRLAPPPMGGAAAGGRQAAAGQKKRQRLDEPSIWDDDILSDDDDEMLALQREIDTTRTDDGPVGGGGGGRGGAAAAPPRPRPLPAIMQRRGGV